MPSIPPIPTLLRSKTMPRFLIGGPGDPRGGWQYIFSGKNGQKKGWNYRVIGNDSLNWRTDLDLFSDIVVHRIPKTGAVNWCFGGSVGSSCNDNLQTDEMQTTQSMVNHKPLIHETSWNKEAIRHDNQKTGSVSLCRCWGTLLSLNHARTPVRT